MTDRGAGVEIPRGGGGRSFNEAAGTGHVRRDATKAAGARGRGMRGVRLMANLSIFLVVAGIVLALPRRDHERLGDKIAAFRSADHDLAFVGCSWTEMNVDPASFDAAAGRGGVELNSINMGLQGAYQGEVSYIVDRLLERPGSLRHVVLNPTPWSAVKNAKREGEEPDEGGPTLREQNWHTLRNTRLALEYSKRVGEGRRGAVRREHIRLFLGRLLRVGTEFGARDEVERGGFLPGVTIQSRRDYEEAVQLFREGSDIDPAPWMELDFGELDRTVDRLKAAGIRAYLVVPPVAARTRAVIAAREYARQRPDVIFLDFADPDRYREFYDYDLRVDHHHLNEEGGMLYSAALAARMLPYLKGTGGRQAEGGGTAGVR